MNKPQVDYDDKDGCVHCLCRKHPVIWQRDLNHIRPPGEKAQHLPLQKPPMSTRHLLARQGDQHGRHISRWTPHHVHPAKKTSAALARPCSPYGGWPNPKRHPLWRACHRAKRCHWPQLRYKDVCKRDMKALDININSWEDLAADCTSWRSTLQKQLQTGEEKLSVATAEK